MTPDHYHSMTDEQLAQWHQLTLQVSTLSGDLTASRAATVAVQAGAEVERSKLLAELRRSHETVLALTTKLAERQSANQQLCGRQVQLMAALRALVDAVGAVECDPETAARMPDLCKRYCEANELLALVEVPFG